MLAKAILLFRRACAPALLLMLATINYASADPGGQQSDRFAVAILLFDDVQIIDFSAPYEVFGHAGFDVFTVSKDGKTVTTAMGLSVNPAHSFASMPAADAVLIPGGDVGDTMADKATLTWLRDQQGSASHILSVCTGSHIVAETGLLDGLSATTFHKAINGFAEDYPAINVEHDKRFVDNGQIITSAGLSSGIDASLHLVSKVLGMKKAKTIALHIEYDWDPNGGFVRAVMADRHFPYNDYDWPTDIQFERLSSIGDAVEWQTVYSARTEATARQLYQSYADAMAAHRNWHPMRNHAEAGHHWQGTGDNVNWQHSVRVAPSSEKGVYILTLSVEQVQETAGS